MGGGGVGLGTLEEPVTCAPMRDDRGRAGLRRWHRVDLRMRRT